MATTTQQIVSFDDFSTFADALDADGPGVAVEDLSTVALEILIEDASPAAKVSLQAAYRAKIVVPEFGPEGPFADDAA